MPPRASLPLVDPIIPTLLRVPFDDPDWLFEPKMDGFRGLAYFTAEGCLLRSKRGFEFTHFGELRGGLRDQFAPDEGILDGEIVSVEDTGRPIFRELLKRGAARLVYFASTCSG